MKHHVAYLTGVGSSPQNCCSRFNPGTRLNLGGGEGEVLTLWTDPPGPRNAK
jgi:hypothetical protein